LDSCLVCGNLTGGHGGGISIGTPVEETIAFYFRNCTIAANRSLDAGGGLYLGWTDAVEDGERSIVWGNCAPSGPQVAAYPSTEAVLDSCDVDTAGIGTWGFFALLNSISEDPLFCDPVDCAEAPTDLGEYHLDAASPCLPSQTGDHLIGAYGEGCDIYTAVAADPNGDERTSADLVPLRISPNPSGGAFAIQYGLSAGASSTLQVFDIAGRLV
jgi:hypothetical protein